MERRGFTLMELLISIAIIGVLSAILFAYLGTSRTQSTDASVRATLVNLRTRAEVLYEVSLNGTYGTMPGSPPYSATCGTIAVVANPTYIFQDSNVQSMIDDAVLRGGGQAKCAAGGSWYVVVVPFKSGANGWCVDSTGASRQIVFGNFTSTDQTCAAANS